MTAAVAPLPRRDRAGMAAAATARTALQTALRAFVRAQPPGASEPPELARWENEGGLVDTLAAQEIGDHALAAREWDAWATGPASIDGVRLAIQAYTRHLRHAHVTLAATLSAIRGAVRESLMPVLSREGLDAVQRDAARSCLEAYFGS